MEWNYDALERGGEKDGRIETTNRIWCIRAQQIFYTIPSSTRNVGKISIFKKNLKEWIKTHIPHEEPPD